MYLRSRSECVPLKEINKVKPSNFTVVPLIYIIDEGHGVTYVQSAEKQSIVQKFKIRSQKKTLHIMLLSEYI